MTITVLDTYAGIDHVLSGPVAERSARLISMLTPMAGMYRYFSGEVDLEAIHRMSFVRAWTGSDGDVRKALQINKYRVQSSSGKSTSRDLESAQCRFESDWGHQSPCGSENFCQPTSSGGCRGLR